MIKRLERDCGEIRLDVEIDGKLVTTTSVELLDSVYVDCIEV